MSLQVFQLAYITGSFRFLEESKTHLPCLIFPFPLEERIYICHFACLFLRERLWSPIDIGLVFCFLTSHKNTYIIYP